MKSAKVLSILLIATGLFTATGCVRPMAPVLPTPPACGQAVSLSFEGLTTDIPPLLTTYDYLPYSLFGTGDLGARYYVLRTATDWQAYWSQRGILGSNPNPAPLPPADFTQEMILGYTELMVCYCNIQKVEIEDVCYFADRIEVSLRVDTYPSNPLCMAPCVMIDGGGDAVVVPLSNLPVVWNKTVVSH